MEFNKSGPIEKVSETRSKRKFHSLGAAVALFSTLTFGGMNLPGLGPKTAVAQEQKEQYVQIEGHKVKVSKLDKPLIELEKETQKYIRPNGQDEVSRSDGYYGNSFVVPGEVAFIVTLNDLGDGEINKNFMNINFPKGRDDSNRADDKRGGVVPV